MRARVVFAAAALALGAVFVGGVGYWLGAQSTPSPQAERTVLYWYDPMVPDTHFDKPGKSPFMDMDLVPRYADEAQTSTGIAIDPGVVQNLGIRLGVVERTPASASVQVSGTLTYNDRALATVQARQDGFVERSHGRAVGDVVRAGDPLVDVRAPVWSAALAEYLVLRGGSDTALGEAARRRLGALGIPAEAIASAERRNLAPSTFTVRAPVSGAIVTLEGRPGAAFSAGQPLATISGLSPVWLVASVPQVSLGGLQAGARASVRFPAFAGETFTGRVDAILPAANLANRTVEVRVALENGDGKLKPGMTGNVNLSGAPMGEVLTTPAEAVIRTGQRTVVIVAHDGGGFEPVEVTLGAPLGDRLEIRSGLAEGQRVVASGQFLIDSEANLSGALEKLRTSAAAPVETYESTGTVTAIDANGVTLAHAPVPQLNWPEMTMAFAWGAVQRDVKIGDAVSFSFRKAASGFELVSLRKVAAK